MDGDGRWKNVANPAPRDSDSDSSKYSYEQVADADGSISFTETTTEISSTYESNKSLFDNPRRSSRVIWAKDLVEDKEGECISEPCTPTSAKRKSILKSVSRREVQPALTHVDSYGTIETKSDFDPGDRNAIYNGVYDDKQDNPLKITLGVTCPGGAMGSSWLAQADAVEPDAEPDASDEGGTKVVPDPGGVNTPCPSQRGNASIASSPEDNSDCLPIEGGTVVPPPPPGNVEKTVIIPGSLDVKPVSGCEEKLASPKKTNLDDIAEPCPVVQALSRPTRDQDLIAWPTKDPKEAETVPEKDKVDVALNFPPKSEIISSMVEGPKDESDDKTSPSQIQNPKEDGEYDFEPGKKGRCFEIEPKPTSTFFTEEERSFKCREYPLGLIIPCALSGLMVILCCIAFGFNAFECNGTVYSHAFGKFKHQTRTQCDGKDVGERAAGLLFICGFSSVVCSFGTDIFSIFFPRFGMVQGIGATCKFYSCMFLLCHALFFTLSDVVGYIGGVLWAIAIVMLGLAVTSILRSFFTLARDDGFVRYGAGIIIAAFAFVVAMSIAVPIQEKWSAGFFVVLYAAVFLHLVATVYVFVVSFLQISVGIILILTTVSTTASAILFLVASVQIQLEIKGLLLMLIKNSGWGLLICLLSPVVLCTGTVYLLLGLCSPGESESGTSSSSSLLSRRDVAAMAGEMRRASRGSGSGQGRSKDAGVVESEGLSVDVSPRSPIESGTEKTKVNAGGPPSTSVGRSEYLTPGLNMRNTDCGLGGESPRAGSQSLLERYYNNIGGSGAPSASFQEPDTNDPPNRTDLGASMSGGSPDLLGLGSCRSDGSGSYSARDRSDGYIARDRVHDPQRSQSSYRNGRYESTRQRGDSHNYFSDRRDRIDSGNYSDPSGVGSFRRQTSRSNRERQAESIPTSSGRSSRELYASPLDAPPINSGRKRSYDMEMESVPTNSGRGRSGLPGLDSGRHNVESFPTNSGRGRSGLPGLGSGRERPIEAVPTGSGRGRSGLPGLGSGRYRPLESVPTNDGRSRSSLPGLGSGRDRPMESVPTGSGRGRQGLPAGSFRDREPELPPMGSGRFQEGSANSPSLSSGRDGRPHRVEQWESLSGYSPMRSCSQNVRRDNSRDTFGSSYSGSSSCSPVQPRLRRIRNALLDDQGSSQGSTSSGRSPQGSDLGARRRKSSPQRTLTPSRSRKRSPNVSLDAKDMGACTRKGSFAEERPVYGSQDVHSQPQARRDSTSELRSRLPASQVGHRDSGRYSAPSSGSQDLMSRSSPRRRL